LVLNYVKNCCILSVNILIGFLMHQQDNITRGVAFERADHGDATHGGPVEGETVNGGHDVGWST
jgi:hypothetical protein